MATKQNRKKKASESRHGKHAPDKVILGCFVTPEEKALALLVANRKGCDVSALMLDGLNYYATEQGIMENGKIKAEFELEIKAVAARIRANKKARQERDTK